MKPEQVRLKFKLKMDRVRKRHDPIIERLRLEYRQAETDRVREFDAIRREMEEELFEAEICPYCENIRSSGNECGCVLIAAE